MSGKRIKILRSDNGGEYTSTEFNDFCREAGIKRELTVPYNTQQNRVVERKNRTIMEADKAMIHDQIYPCSYGQKHPEQLYMYITDAHIR